MRTVIKLDHVSKKFSEEQVLKDVCFEFQEGKIYGGGRGYFWTKCP